MERLKHGHDDEGFSTQNIFKDMPNSWFTRVPPVMISHGVDVADIEFQIHCIETEAYGAVLRAFTAQSDVLSWDKEVLISNLRKELRVSDIEHRELLAKVDSDDSVRMIREWHKCMDAHREVQSDTIVPSVPGSVGHTFNKRRKSSHVSTSSSPYYLPCARPASGAISSSVATHLRESQCGGETAAPFRMEHVGLPIKSVGLNGQVSLLSKERGPVTVQLRKDLKPPDLTNFKRSSDIIEIYVTDRLIHEVKKVISGKRLDPVQVEKAKLILREQEQAILEALEKLADVSDGLRLSL